MFVIRKAAERGHANHGWLNAKHSFSFGDYYDPAHMGFRCLRVINEDRIAAGKGFGTHPHRDMEILTYILEGELAHKDSMGNGRTIQTGEVQGMSAGTGITHSEYNASATHETHLLQIWILPHTQNVTPRYAEWNPSRNRAQQGWQLAASEEGRDGSIPIHQDARMWVGAAQAGGTLPVALEKERFGWLQIAKGSATLHTQAGESVALTAGDGLAFSADALQHISATEPSEWLLFDLP